MKRTGFKSKGRKRLSSPPFEQPALKRSLAVKGLTRSGKGIRRVGRRAKVWASVWRFLKPRLAKAGRTGCEFQWFAHWCWGPLDPAHSKKRNKMVGDDIYAVAIACRQMHRILDETMTHEEMEDTVMMAIERAGGMILPEPKAA